MQEQVIREIAQQILREQFFENWMMYALLVAVAFLSSVASAYLVKYIGKRAETHATKADLEEVLRQIRKTTEVTEEVRTSISHADWVTREWKAIRRTKLEELLEHAYATDNWLYQQRGKWIFDKADNNLSSPTNRVSQLATLYFPELSVESSALVLAERNVLSWIIKTAIALNAAGKDLSVRQVVFDQAISEWEPLYTAVHKAISAIAAKAPSVMKEITGA